MEEGEEKNYLVSLIVNQMKKSYLTWNRPQVSDDVILSDLRFLSGGKLKIPEGMKISDAKDLIQQQRKKQPQKQQIKKQNKHSGRKKGINRH